ncbi:MAG: periplasmic heavy metal sensor [Candidatus Lambdaproteobacteria bacterium]|nr:periplasmic heavy metal sensor [Candidatus Lambdaproteobacteria bacterium]
MKRILLLALLSLFIAAALRAQPPEGYGPPAWAPVPAWGGPGASGGWGPGMMGVWGGGGWGYPGWGAGAGPWGGWGSAGVYGQIPQDKRNQLRDLGVETQRKWIGQQAAFEEQAAAYQAALDKFPLDRAAATKAWEAMNGLRKQMAEVRLDAMAKAQQMLGKELWEKLRAGWGPYPGGAPGRR